MRIISILLLWLSATSVVQATMLTGSIDSTDGGGMFATGSWDDGGAVLTYQVTKEADHWKYVYNFNVGAKELSNIIFQVSDSFTEANILAGTSSGWELDVFGGQGGSSPGIPSSLYGIKFEGGLSLLNELIIVSDREPMWGDFYAKDGTDKGVDVYAYNVGFGDETMANYWQPVFGKILVPDTLGSGGGQVSEPAIVSLLALGLIGMTSISGRKFSS